MLLRALSSTLPQQPPGRGWGTHVLGVPYGLYTLPKHAVRDFTVVLCYSVTSVLPLCCQDVAGALPLCYHDVAGVLPWFYRVVTRVFSLDDVNKRFRDPFCCPCVDLRIAASVELTHRTTCCEAAI